MNNIKILFVHPSKSSFIQRDLELLKRHFYEALRLYLEVANEKARKGLAEQPKSILVEMTV